jgi:hypothetical protein
MVYKIIKELISSFYRRVKANIYHKYKQYQFITSMARVMLQTLQTTSGERRGFEATITDNDKRKGKIDCVYGTKHKEKRYEEDEYLGTPALSPYRRGPPFPGVRHRPVGVSIGSASDV